ncbi:MAG: tetratricopeptide repeat protein [Candidatus Melainabacteria bacterium]|nr:MAG: tetratricopeptide repeat protein [Candidatus Melainabacteria bacterium]
MSEWKALRAALLCMSISLVTTLPAMAQGISEMGAVHSMSATMGAGLHSQSGAASGGLNSVYGSLNKQLGAAASGSGGSAGGSGANMALGSTGDFPNVPVDPRLTVVTAGKESNRLYDLAVQKQKAGKNAEAEQLFLRSAAIRQTIWGNKDPAVWKIMEQIGALKTKRGDFAGAEQWYRVVLTAELKHYGAGTYELVPILEKMGQVSLAQKKYSDAQNYLQQVYTQRARKFGKDNAETVASALELARAYSESGDLSSAADLLGKTVDAKLNDAGSPQMIKLLEAYMAVLKKQNKQEEFTRIESKLNTMKPAPIAKSESNPETASGNSGSTDGSKSATSSVDATKTADAKTPDLKAGTAENKSSSSAAEADKKPAAKPLEKQDEWVKKGD